MSAQPYVNVLLQFASSADNSTVGDAVQLSDPEADRSAAEITAVPADREMEALDAVTAGAVWSTTVITAVSVWVLPEASVAVRVTVTGVPTSLQSNAVMSKARLDKAQSSEEPLSTSLAVIEAAPLASRTTVKSCATATGSAESMHSSLSQTPLLLVSTSMLPHPHNPGAVLLGSLGQPSPLSHVPSPSVSVPSLAGS